jgi:hypothetical protein
MRFRGWWTWAVLLVAVFAVGCLPVPSPEEPTPPVGGRATLGIEVLDDVTGEPVVSADVTLHTGDTGLTDAAGYVAWELPTDPRDGERGVTVVADGYHEGYLTVPAFTENTHVRMQIVPIPPPAPEPDPDPEPDPAPHPAPIPPVVVDACGPQTVPMSNRITCVDQVTTSDAGREWWAKCKAGSGVACHRVVRLVATALATHDVRWGLLGKEPGQQQCTLSQCGPLGGEGFGEDIVTYRTGPDVMREFEVFDIIVGAGAAGAATSWQHQPRRPGNFWAAVP